MPGDDREVPGYYKRRPHLSFDHEDLDLFLVVTSEDTLSRMILVVSVALLSFGSTEAAQGASSPGPFKLKYIPSSSQP